MKHTFKIIGALLILSLCVAPAAAADAWPAAMADYDYYQTIEYAGCDQETYQQDIVIHRSTGTAYNETAGGLETWHIFVGNRCKSDYGDIRFTDASGTALDYYLWPDYDSSSARFTVRLEGATSAGQMQVWYGNPEASTTSNPDATYFLHDHFDGSALDASTWTSLPFASGTGSVSVSGGICTITHSGGTGWQIVSTPTFGTNVTLQCSLDIPSASLYAIGGFVTDAYGVMVYANYPTGGQFNIVNRNPYPSESTTPIGSGYTGYREYTISRNGMASTIFHVDGTKAGELTGNVPTCNLQAAFVAQGQTIYIDYVLVRAYSATPPAATTFSGEQEAVADLTAAFSVDDTTSTPGTSLIFTDGSYGGGTITAWSWNFGDTGTSTLQNPTHSYSTPGTYTVTLTVTDSNTDTDTETKTDYITIGNAPTAAFSGNPTSGSSPLSVTFTDSSTHTPTSWDWDFGDSSEHSTSQNPSHSYSSNGAYTVTLTATNAYGSDTETKTNYIAVADLTAAFSVDDTTSTPGTSLIFTDGSYGGGTITAWSWNFGDTGTSTLQNPTHSYSTPGTYTVTLTVTDSNTDTDTETKTDYITIGNAPTAAFSGTPLSGASPLTVSFTDSSTAPTSWSWNFGDGGTSSLQNPSHEYAQDGAYTVTLTVTNPYGSDTETKTDYISLGSMTTAAFSSLSEGSLNQTIRFTDESLNSPTSWDWDFGDGSTHAIIQNPTHSYDSTGTYTVTLTASNAISSDTISHTITIVLFAHRPTAAATVAPLDDTAYNEIMDSLNLGESYVNADESGIDYRIIISSAVGYIVGPLGAFGYLIIFFAAFGGMWIVQKDTLIPGLIGMVYGAILYKMLPGEFQMITIVVLALSATGVVWSLYIRKDT